MQILPGSVYRLAHRFLIFNLVKKMYLKKSEDKKTLSSFCSSHNILHKYKPCRWTKFTVSLGPVVSSPFSLNGG
jgi:hypothetical protein